METKIKVLLADNSEYFGKPCADAMRAHDLEVYTVEKDGKQVLEGIAKRHPQLVLIFAAVGRDRGDQGHRRAAFAAGSSDHDHVQL